MYFIDTEKVQEELGEFIWNFQHGDNIMYNFRVLKALYQAKDRTNPSRILNKPITIQIVSIVEAVLIDFLVRIDQATTHLPAEIDADTIQRMKREMNSDKREVRIEDEYGELSLIHI